MANYRLRVGFSSNYSLTAESGSFLFTGQSATLNLVTQTTTTVSTTFDSGYASDFALRSDTSVVTLPAQTKPAKSSSITTGGYTDATFSTAIRRITSVSDQTGATANWLRHEYSRRQMFNADNTMFIAGGASGWWFLYNATTNAVIPSGVTTGAGTGGLLNFGGDCEPIWHPTDPTKIWHTDTNGSMTWYETTVSLAGGTPTRTVLFNLSTLINALGAPWTSGVRAWFNGEGRPSHDGRWWGLHVENSAFGSIGVIMYDRQLNQIVFTALTGGNDPNWVGTSPLGNYVVVSWYGTPAADIAGEQARPNNTAAGCRAFAKDGSGYTTMQVMGEHSDMMIDQFGNEVYVAATYRAPSDGFPGTPNDMGVFVRKLSDGTGYMLPIPAYDGGPNTEGFHISGCAYDRPGWAVISKYASVNGGRYDGQILVVELKETSPRICRLAHHRSTVSGTDYYFAEPHATASRDLTRVVFTSDFGTVNASREDYCICLPSWAIPDTPAVGQSTATYDIHTAGVSPKTTLGITTEAHNGTAFLFAGFDVTAIASATHNKTGTLTQLGQLQYTNWAPYGVRLYQVQGMAGGTGHTFTVTKATGFEASEISLLAVGVANATTVVSQSIQELPASAAATVTSGTVTTTGRAVLLSAWFGDANVSTPMTADPITAGWTKLEDITIDGQPHVQCALAYREVTTPGDYTCQWSHTPNQRAIMVTLAVQ